MKRSRSTRARRATRANPARRRRRTVANPLDVSALATITLVGAGGTALYYFLIKPELERREREQAVIDAARVHSAQKGTSTEDSIRAVGVVACQGAAMSQGAPPSPQTELGCQLAVAGLIAGGKLAAKGVVALGKGVAAGGKAVGKTTAKITVGAAKGVATGAKAVAKVPVKIIGGGAKGVAKGTASAAKTVGKTAAKGVKAVFSLFGLEEDEYYIAPRTRKLTQAPRQRRRPQTSAADSYLAVLRTR